MRVAVIIDSEKGYSSLKEHLSFRQIEEIQGLEIVRGKMQNQPVIVFNSKQLNSAQLFNFVPKEEISCIVSLGFVERFSDPLVPGDVLVAGEVDAKPVQAKLIDWCLAAVDESEDFTGLRVVVGSLNSVPARVTVEGHIYGIDAEANDMAVLAEQHEVPILFIRLTKSAEITANHEQFYKESEQKFFRLIRGILDQISKSRHYLTSDSDMI